MSLRARLAIATAAAATVAVVLASVLVYFLVRNELERQVDRNLQAEATEINKVPRFLAALYAPNVYALDVRGPIFGGYFQLVDAQGRVYIPETFITPTPRLPVTDRVIAVSKGTADGFYYDTRLQGQDTRVFTRATGISGTAPQAGTVRYAIQVVADLSGVDRELSTIRLWLFVVALGGVGIASVAGFLVARAALRPVRDLSDTAEHVRLTRDLTQRIDVEGNDELSRLALTFNAMLESLDEAAQRQRQLVQDASHELRTPLTSLRTNIEVLARGDALPPEDRAQLLGDVVAQLGEMTALISELTELARGEEKASQLEDVRLDLLTEDAIRRATRNHPDVPIQADLAPASMVGTPASLERAIANLLDNAAKWSPPGGPVEVRLAGGELTVRDHGPGIAEADLAHVFERFYRATSARSMPGSGLGLAIVQQVAEAHGGSVTAERAPGGGTLMRLRLPVSQGARAAEADPAVLAQG